jgi:hypothetical protein
MPYPHDWLTQNVVWSPDGTDLFFVERTTPESQALRRFRLRGGLDPVPLATVGPRSEIRDVHPSADGSKLAYLIWAAGRTELHLRDLDSGADRVVTSLEGPLLEVFNHGWTRGDRGIVLARRAGQGPDRSNGVELIEVSPAGAQRRIALLPAAYIATLRVDAARARFVITRTAGGAHNLYLGSLSTGEIRQVTDNRLPGVSFSGVESRPGGAIVYVLDTQKRDIWLMRAQSR